MVEGGLTVTNVVGAVPKLENGDVVAVPPLILSGEPGLPPPGSDQVVVNTNCVPDPAVRASTWM